MVYDPTVIAGVFIYLLIYLIFCLQITWRASAQAHCGDGFWWWWVRVCSRRISAEHGSNSWLGKIAEWSHMCDVVAGCTGELYCLHVQLLLAYLELEFQLRYCHRSQSVRPSPISTSLAKPPCRSGWNLAATFRSWLVKRGLQSLSWSCDFKSVKMVDLVNSLKNLFLQTHQSECYQAWVKTLGRGPAKLQVQWSYLFLLYNYYKLNVWETGGSHWTSRKFGRSF